MTRLFLGCGAGADCSGWEKTQCGTLEPQFVCGGPDSQCWRGVCYRPIYLAVGGIISQRYVWYHKGLDIAAPMGTPELAADAGRIMVSGWPDNTGYGNRVMIDHGNGYVTLYGHMSKIYVTVGQTVRRGDVIGTVGSTGRSTGPHLHFEIRKFGVAVNPLDYLK